ncbi:MAG: hypothetical protein WBF12_21000, partial [Bradyrhizobium sp.]
AVEARDLLRAQLIKALRGHGCLHRWKVPSFAAGSTGRTSRCDYKVIHGNPQRKAGWGQIATPAAPRSHP